MITTASSTFSRQEGDSIETVDRLGHLHLVEAAKRAGVRQFIYISIPPGARHTMPALQAKDEVEAALERSGMEYTVLLANYFMEVWLSPALGFDYENRRATIYGSGEAAARLGVLPGRGGLRRRCARQRRRTQPRAARGRTPEPDAA